MNFAALLKTDDIWATSQVPFHQISCSNRKCPAVMQTAVHVHKNTPESCQPDPLIMHNINNPKKANKERCLYQERDVSYNKKQYKLLVVVWNITTYLKLRGWNSALQKSFFHLQKTLDKFAAKKQAISLGTFHE